MQGLGERQLQVLAMQIQARRQSSQPVKDASEAETTGPLRPTGHGNDTGEVLSEEGASGTDETVEGTQDRQGIGARFILRDKGASRTTND